VILATVEVVVGVRKQQWWCEKANNKEEERQRLTMLTKTFCAVNGTCTIDDGTIDDRWQNNNSTLVVTWVVIRGTRVYTIICNINTCNILCLTGLLHLHRSSGVLYLFFLLVTFSFQHFCLSSWFSFLHCFFHFHFHYCWSCYCCFHSFCLTHYHYCHCRCLHWTRPGHASIDRKQLRVVKSRHW
jgi:hypothetical protein